MSDTKTPRVRMTHAAVKVSNIKNSIEFLTKALNVKPAWAGQTDWGMVKSEGTTLALIEKNEEVHPPHIGFVVDRKEDIDYFYAQIQAAGGLSVEPPKDHRDQSRSFYFKDPDGNQFELLWIPDHLTR